MHRCMLLQVDMNGQIVSATAWADGAYINCTPAAPTSFQQAAVPCSQRSQSNTSSDAGFLQHSAVNFLLKSKGSEAGLRTSQAPDQRQPLTISAPAVKTEYAYHHEAALQSLAHIPMEQVNERSCLSLQVALSRRPVDVSYSGVWFIWMHPCSCYAVLALPFPYALCMLALAFPYASPLSPFSSDSRPPAPLECAVLYQHTLNDHHECMQGHLMDPIQPVEHSATAEALTGAPQTALAEAGNLQGEQAVAGHLHYWQQCDDHSYTEASTVPLPGSTYMPESWCSQSMTLPCTCARAMVSGPPW